MSMQLVSYMDETAMNVAQELADDELYDYDTLVKLFGDRFDHASRVSASRSRSMAARDATMRIRMRMPMPSPSYAALDIHRAHRSSVKNLLVTNLSGGSQTLN